MDNHAIGGSAFTHYSLNKKNLLNRTPKARFSFKPLLVVAGFICLALMMVTMMAMVFAVLSYFTPHISLWNARQVAVESRFGGYRDRVGFGWSHMSLLWGYIPAVVIMGGLPLAFSKMNHIVSQLMGVVALLLLCFFLMMANPFVAKVSPEATFNEWSESRYGLQLKEGQSIGASRDDVIYHDMYRDKDRNIIFSIQDPKRNNEIFLYQADARTELPMKENTTNGK